MVRAAAKNHANVAIVTSPSRYPEVLAALDATAPSTSGCAASSPRGVRATPPPTTRGSPSELPGRLSPPALLDPPEDPYPATLSLALEKVETLRYGENPHQPAARYRRPGATIDDGPFGVDRAAAPGQDALVQQRARCGGGVGARSGAAGPGRRHRQAHQSVRRRRARRRSSRPGQAALEADPVSAFGGIVALTRPVDARDGPAR